MREKPPVITEESKPATFGWLQVEKKAAQTLRQLALKSPVAMATLIYFMENMGRNNALAVSQTVIAEKVGVGRQAISPAVKLLAEKRFIEIVKVGNLCVYRVNTRVAWQGKRGERFAFFQADVIAFEGEQDRDLEDNKPLAQLPMPTEGERVLIGNEQLDPPDQQEMELP